MNQCTDRAIHTAHGLIFGTMYLVMAVIMKWLYFFTADRLPVVEKVLPPKIRSVQGPVKLSFVMFFSIFPIFFYFRAIFLTRTQLLR